MRKMLLMFEDAHKKHISFLSTLDVSVIREFCRISMEFIRKGMNPKVYQAAAQKLDVDGDDVKSGVEGLTYLLVESSRLMLSELDFQDTVMSLGFSDELQQILVEMHTQNSKDIRKILTEMSKSSVQCYKNLEWRLDVELASRSLVRQTTPIIMLKVHTDDQDREPKSTVLQTDPVNLLHLTKVLDGALQEMKSAYSRRIARNIK